MLGALVTVLSGGGASATTAATAASRLLFGENLTLEANTLNTDWFLSQPALRAGLVNAHVTIIRLPIRGSNANDPAASGFRNWPEVQAALTDIKAMGVTPLVILRNPRDTGLLGDDTTVVNYVKSLFGGRRVYYEFGNEPDLAGIGQVDAATYLSKWNSTVPQLKALAGPGAKFIGPASYQYDLPYLQAFLTGASPLPDAVSWHSYTCNDTTDNETTCLANIGHWAGHIAEARAWMTSTLGRQLPIWITEWNYTPAVDSSASNANLKYNDTAFLRQWTTKALRALAADGVAASMHFNVNGLLPLVNPDGSLAAQGVSFSAAYCALVNPVPR
jgi:hypothetical protein